MKIHKAFSIGHTNCVVTFCGLKVPDGEYCVVPDRKNWIIQREISEMASEPQECKNCAAIVRYWRKASILDLSSEVAEESSSVSKLNPMIS